MGFTTERTDFIASGIGLITEMLLSPGRPQCLFSGLRKRWPRKDGLVIKAIGQQVQEESHWMFGVMSAPRRRLCKGIPQILTTRFQRRNWRIQRLQFWCVCQTGINLTPQKFRVLWRLSAFWYVMYHYQRWHSVIWKPKCGIKKFSINIFISYEICLGNLKKN